MKYVLIAWAFLRSVLPALRKIVPLVKTLGLKVYPGAKVLLRKLGGWATTALRFLHILKPLVSAAPAPTTTTAPATTTQPEQSASSATQSKHMTPLAILELLFSPLGRYIGMALIGLSIVAVLFGKGVTWEHKRITNEIQMESKDAIAKSDAARGNAVKRFDAGRLRNDGFARD